MFFFLSTKMLPVVAGLLPVYLFAKNAGLLDNIWLLVLLYTSMNLPIAVWMMQSFLADVPVSIIEAAQVDGARLPTVLRRVVAPVAGPGIAATALICFIFSWNELLFARVLTGVVVRHRARPSDHLRHQPGALPRPAVRGVRGRVPAGARREATPPRTNSSRASRWEQSNEGSHRRSRRQGLGDHRPGPRARPPRRGREGRLVRAVRDRSPHPPGRVRPDPADRAGSRVRRGDRRPRPGRHRAVRRRQGGRGPFAALSRVPLLPVGARQPLRQLGGDRSHRARWRGRVRGGARRQLRTAAGPHRRTGRGADRAVVLRGAGGTTSSTATSGPRC